MLLVNMPVVQSIVGRLSDRKIIISRMIDHVESIFQVMSPIKRHIVLAIVQILQLMDFMGALDISFSIALQGAFLNNFWLVLELICRFSALLHDSFTIATEQIFLYG